MAMFPCKKNKDQSDILHPYLFKREALTGKVTFDGERILCDYKSTLTNYSQALEWIYKLLDILDAKAGALLRLSSLMLTATAFFFGNAELFSGGDGFSRIFTLIMSIGGVCSAVAIVLCLQIVRVKWPFLTNVKAIPEANPTRFDFTCEFKQLKCVMDKRQTVLCWAWWLSLIASSSFLVVLLWFWKEKFCEF